MRGTHVLSVIGLLTLVGAIPASAQFDRSDIDRPFAFDVYGGGHKFDGSDETGIGFGARLLLNHRSGLAFGGNFTWVTRTEKILAGDQDVTVYYYNAEAQYTFPAGMIEPFLGAGAGAATVDLGDVEGSGSLQLANTPGASDTYFMVPLSGGVKIFNGTHRIGVLVEGRDHVVFVSDDADAGVDGKTTHNWAIGAGVEFQFGGP
jgi:hypothetical protein